MSRMLAAKASLATRVDALGEDGNFDLGAEHKVKLEARLRILEEGNLRRISGTGKAKAKFEKYHGKSEFLQYPAAADTTISSGKRRYSEIGEKTPIIEEIETNPTEEVPKKKKKKHSVEPAEETTVKEEVEVKMEEEPIPKKKKKKSKQEPGSTEDIKPTVDVIKTESEEIPDTLVEVAGQVEEQKKKKKKKKKEKHSQETQEIAVASAETMEQVPSEKKKKEKHSQECQETAVVSEETMEHVPSEKKKKKKKSQNE